MSTKSWSWDLIQVCSVGFLELRLGSCRAALQTHYAVLLTVHDLYHFNSKIATSFHLSSQLHNSSRSRRSTVRYDFCSVLTLGIGYAWPSMLPSTCTLLSMWTNLVAISNDVLQWVYDSEQNCWQPKTHSSKIVVSWTYTLPIAVDFVCWCKKGGEINFGHLLVQCVDDSS